MHPLATHRSFLASRLRHLKAPQSDAWASSAPCAILVWPFANVGCLLMRIAMKRMN